jgi:hypothetical protein
VDASRLFPPRHTTREEAHEGILHVLRRDPRQFGFSESRWRLKRLLEVCDWLQLTTLAGLSQLLRRLKISYKRAREYLHSPDPDYQEKLSLIELARLRAWYEPETYAFFYLDELSFYRQPSLSWAYEERGNPQPLARLSYHSNTRSRVIAALNACTGQVIYRQRHRISVDQLSAFYADLRAAYPDLKTLYVAQDNWPVHFHPDVLARLEPQTWPFPFNVPGNWSNKPSKKAVQDNLPIQILCLPIYASWCNPIEKLWRWLRQDILHLHRMSNEWQALKDQVNAFLDTFASGSDELLHYVGLLPD